MKDKITSFEELVEKLEKLSNQKAKKVEIHNEDFSRSRTDALEINGFTLKKTEYSVVGKLKNPHVAWYEHRWGCQECGDSDEMILYTTYTKMYKMLKILWEIEDER